VAWFVLARLWGTKTVDVVRINRISFALLVVGFLLTFPPFMDLLQGK
jgi:heme/copper-type cytochrome/quinol oxidase subunit 1